MLNLEKIKLFVPPIGLIAYRKISFYLDLFNGDNELFKDLLAKSLIYGEYGCGASTSWVLENTNAQVYSTDSSSAWVALVKSKNQTYQRLTIKAVDVGNVGELGRPEDYSRRAHFTTYTDWLWQQEQVPDTILIDGRFRVCCFLTCLKYAKEGTKIIFDDYINRPYYHVVEEFIPRSKTCGRQCLFIVPAKSTIDTDKLEHEIKMFRYVFE